MIWTRSYRADPAARLIADRHYNRQKVGSPQFVPPGRCLVLRADPPSGGRALWVTSWPFAEFVKHQWAGAWVCSLFRNEGAGRASDLIRQAVAATIAEFGPPPALGMITFVDQAKVRAKADPGHTYIIAGFRPCGRTKGGLLAFQLLPEAMPPARQAMVLQPDLLDAGMNGLPRLGCARQQSGGGMDSDPSPGPQTLAEGAPVNDGISAPASPGKIGGAYGQ